VGARSKARKRALDVLFEADQRGVPALDVLALRVAAADPPVREHTVALVEGVVAHQDEIDGLIRAHLVGWDVARMPAVDRAVLRLAVFELRHAPDVPPAVAIDEAVELAKQLSTEESPALVNGVLARILDEAAAARDAAQ
jgi:N utilization substance protein B